MKIHLSQIKFYISITCIAFTFFVPVNAQNNPVVNYLQQVGDHADIYNGRMESPYSVILYDNLPYYVNSNFTDATLVYRNIYYPNQKVRLDLFRNQLILLPPEKRFGVIVNSQNLERVTMYNKTFIWLTPPKESGLKAGYYIQLLDKEKMQLLCKTEFILQSPQPSQMQQTQQRLTNSFYQKTQYYLLYNNQYNKVKDKGSFSKLFPQYKKQINKFSKDHSLNFKMNADESLMSLADYCEELLTSTNK